MTTGVKYPGNYTLRQFMLSVPTGDRSDLDISYLIPSFTIQESIENDSIRGQAQVIDSAGVLENYPLRAEEYATIVVEDATGYTRSYYLFIYKIDDVRADENDKRLSYTIHFTSIQRWLAGTKTVIAAYDDPPSRIAADIFAKNYGGRILDLPLEKNADTLDEIFRKPLVAEPMNEPINVAIPNFSPMRAMKFLTDRSFSLTSPSCSFRFFENADYFYYASDEFLYRIGSEQERIYEFTSVQVPRTVEYFNEQMNNLEAVKVRSHINSAQDLMDGSYKSLGYVMDFNYGLFEEFKYDYNEEKDKYFENSEQMVDRHDQLFTESFFTYEASRKFYIVKTYDELSAGSVMGNQEYPRIVANKIAYRNHLKALSLEAKGPGRLDITCGDVVNLTVTAVSADNTVNLNTQLSGKYIVQSVTKVFDKETMTNLYTLIKRGWNE